MDLGLANAAVCVQGGTRGMGRAAAECFASDGARVVVLGRDPASIDETVARLAELGSPDAWGVSADLLVPESIVEAFRKIDERWGELNTLVNAAGLDRSPFRRRRRRGVARELRDGRDEIGPVIAFVGSRRNSYMTGANINVDGGSDFT